MQAKAEKPRPFDAQWAAYARFTVRRPWLLFVLGLFGFLAGLPGSVRLYGDLRTDLRELLPRGAPAAVALEELEQRVGGLSHLAIVVRTQDLKAGERFVDALTARLRKLPPDLVARVQGRIDDERTYFEAHGALYAELKDLQQIRDALRTRIGSANPLAVDLLDDDAPSKPAAATSGGDAAQSAAELDHALGKVKSAFGRLDHFLDGYLAGEGGTTLVVLVSPPGAGVSLEHNQQIMHAVEREVAALDPQSFSPTLKVGYGGEVRTVIEAQEALVRDLLISSILVLLAVGFVLILYYRSFRAIPLLVLPLFTGVSITFGLSRILIHYLNPNTAFLGSIIVGNGINPGIILLARFFEERRRGLPVVDALRAAMQTTWQGTFTASAGAAVSYGSLVFVRFRGFNQFGLMGFVGMLTCWAATYFVMPALIVLFERLRTSSAHARLQVGPGLVAAPYARTLVRHPGLALGIAGLLTVGSAIALHRFAQDPIQYDFTKLGSRSGVNSGASYWDSHVDAVLQSYQTPTVVLTDSPEKAQAVAKALEAVKAEGGLGATIDSVQTLQKLLPTQQDEKLPVLRDIFAMLTPRVVASLPADAQPVAERLKGKTQLREVTLADVPSRLTMLFKEKNGQQGRIVLAYPTLDTDSRNGKAQMAHAQLVRQTALRADPDARVAGQIVLTSDIVSTITDDGAFAGGLSFAAVALLTILVMRSLRHGSWVLGSLALGVAWMFGALGAFSIKFNFVNFVVLPITFGIGVDYAVNLYQRYRQVGSVAEALSSAGGAVALCSCTTIIGYAALLVADNQAIWSFGLTAVIGEITCLSAALFALPALLAWHDGRTAPAGELSSAGELGDAGPR